jgi:methionyl-tRNA formyltransferase
VATRERPWRDDDPTLPLANALLMPVPLQRVLLIGDSTGIPELLERMPGDRVAGIVAAAIRPQYHDALQRLAIDRGVPMLIQPRVDAPDYAEFIAALRSLAPDSLICHSYSMLLRPDLLSLVSGRAFNLHLALLPRHRGPNPIQWALIHGDANTGATLHVMNESFDRGPIVDQESIAIDDTDTWASLLERARDAGRYVLDRTLPALLAGTWTARPQDEREAVTNTRIPRESLPIDFVRMTDRQIVDLVRAQVAPLQGAYLESGAGRLRFTAPITPAEAAAMRRQYAD